MKPFLFLGSLAILAWPSTVLAIQISEIAYDLPGSDTGREWVELLNETDQPIDLTGWLFVDDSNHKLAIPPAKGGQGSLIVQPSQYLILADNASQWLSEHSGYVSSVVDSVISLPNYQAGSPRSITLKLVDTSATARHEITFQPTDPGRLGYTWERQSSGEWQNSRQVGGTPGLPPNDNQTSYSSSVRLSEIMSNPEGADDDQEWIELFNQSDQSVDLSGWYVTDKATASGQINREIFPAGATIPALGYYQFRFKDSVLNNSDETVNLFWPNNQSTESITLSGSAPEGASWARFDSDWQWTSQPTPGQLNQWQALISPSPSPSFSQRPSPLAKTTSSPTKISPSTNQAKPASSIIQKSSSPLLKNPSPTPHRQHPQSRSAPPKTTLSPASLLVFSPTPMVMGTASQDNPPSKPVWAWIIPVSLGLLLLASSLVKRWQLIRRWPKLRALFNDDLIT